MPPFKNYLGWDTGASAVKQMQEKQIIDNELHRQRCYNNALERGDVVFPKNNKECENVCLTLGMFINCSCCDDSCY